MSALCPGGTRASSSHSGEVHGGGDGVLLTMAPLSESLGRAYLWAPPENCFPIKIAFSRRPGPLY